jgi:hypothetical protein
LLSFDDPSKQESVLLLITLSRSVLSQVLEAVSETISPLLPVVLLVGQQQAALRLASRGITTLQPKRIAIAGR